MKKPGIVPQNSDWPMLFNDKHKGVIFYHKLGQGNTDVTFRNLSHSEIEELQGKLPEGAELVKHSKSCSVRVFSGKVDRTKAFEEQVDLVRKGLENLEGLRVWLDGVGL